MRHLPLVVAILAILSPSLLAGGLRGEQQLDGTISPSGSRESLNTQVSSSGAIMHATWTEVAVSTSTSQDIWYRRSTDGGRSWSAPINLSGAPGVDDDKARVKAEGSLVVVAWLHGDALVTQDVRARVSTNGGVTFGPVLELSGPLKGDAGDADSLRLKISGSNVYVLFEDNAAAPGGVEDIYVVASGDGGATFSNPVRVNDTTAGTVDCDDPELDAVGATAYMVWVDKRTGNDRVYFSVSNDGGATWAANKLLDRGTALSDAGNPSMSVDGANVHIAWVDDRNNPAVADQVFYVSSVDGGATFSLDRRIGGAAAGVDADDPRVSVSGSHVYAAWVDNRNGLNNDVFLAVSADGGATFATEFPLDPDAGTIHDVDVHLRTQGDSVFVSYQEETSTPLLHQLWISASPNRGAPGSFQRLHLSATLGAGGDVDDHDIEITDYRDVVAVWTDDRAGGGNPTNDVYVNGQRFPELSVVNNGDLTRFQLDGATPAEENQLFLAVLSQTGTSTTILPGGMNISLTIDSLTLLLIQPWALQLLMSPVQGGAASTIPLKFKNISGYAVGVVFDAQGQFLAATDPVAFP